MPCSLCLILQQCAAVFPSFSTVRTYSFSSVPVLVRLCCLSLQLCFCRSTIFTPVSLSFSCVLFSHASALSPSLSLSPSIYTFLLRKLPQCVFLPQYALVLHLCRSPMCLYSLCLCLRLDLYMCRTFRLCLSPSTCTLFPDMTLRISLSLSTSAFVCVSPPTPAFTLPLSLAPPPFLLTL